MPDLSKGIARRLTTSTRGVKAERPFPAFRRGAAVLRASPGRGSGTPGLRPPQTSGGRGSLPARRPCFLLRDDYLRTVSFLASVNFVFAYFTCVKYTPRAICRPVSLVPP